MKAIYRGHEITVTREKALAGYTMLYYSIFRQSDGLECMSMCEDSEETVKKMVGYLKDMIDAELKEPIPWKDKE